MQLSRNPIKARKAAFLLKKNNPGIKADEEMEAVDAKQIAQEYAKSKGYDTVREAGEKDGYKYFHYYNKAILGHKLGLPHIIKINSNGVVYDVDDFSETMWARGRIIKMHYESK